MVTYEAVIENGHVRLAPGVDLPDRARVFVVVPDQTETPGPRIWSPRLVHPHDAAGFRMEVRDEAPDAHILRRTLRDRRPLK